MTILLDRKVQLMAHETQTVATDQISTGGELPRWDLSRLYPGLNSVEFKQAFATLLEAIGDLEREFDRREVGWGSALTLDSDLVRDFESVLSALNALHTTHESMTAYLYGNVTTDSGDELAQARFSELRQRGVALDKLETRFTAWVGRIPVDELIATSPLAAAHDFPLRRLREAAGHLMSEAEENVAAELGPSGGMAWSRLHGNLTSQITASVELDGRREDLPISAARNLAMHGDRDVRQRAWHAELEAWERHALPLAAALNGVKGEVIALSARRHWADPLDEAVFQSNIDRDILDAMLGEARASLPGFRRYFRLKAQALGLEELSWFDLFAPVGEAVRPWSWTDAAAFIEEQFGSYSPRMQRLAQRAYDERWIDASPRLGKVGGGYCMWLIDGESRILVNYVPAYDGVSTLAHELGHAYHNLNVAGLTPLQRITPMTLAETASTYCETIVKEAALVDATAGERLYIIEQSLQGAAQIVVDILSRFEFERAVFAGRRDRELSVGELNRLMLAAQESTYGEGLAKDARHPYMWAVKGHYYNPGRSFYNFPYLFGLLFGLGLFARYQAHPEGFHERYDELLASTGLASAADLAARFDIDLRAREFWRSSLDVLRADIERFAELVGG
jgi:pepF/M3 family oligoendopeptidase